MSNRSRVSESHERFRLEASVRRVHLQARIIAQVRLGTDLSNVFQDDKLGLQSLIRRRPQSILDLLVGVSEVALIPSVLQQHAPRLCAVWRE